MKVFGCLQIFSLLFLGACQNDAPFSPLNVNTAFAQLFSTWPEENPVPSPHSSVPGAWISQSQTISAGYRYSCTLAEEGIRCWGDDDNKTGILNPPIHLKNPRSLVGGDYFSCVLTDEGMRCWGRDTSYIEEAASGWKNPYALTATNSSLCALTDDGARCWHSPPSPNGFKNIRSLSFNGHVACGLTDTGLNCWSYNSDSDGPEAHIPSDLGVVTSVAVSEYISTFICALSESGSVQCWNKKWRTSLWSGLKNPHSLIANRTFICVIDDDGPHCKSVHRFEDLHDPSYEVEIPSDLGTIRSLALGFQHICAATDQGPRCWSDQRYPQDVPADLKNPQLLSAASNNSCAMTDEGIRCWGPKYRWPVPEAPHTGEIAQDFIMDRFGIHSCLLTDQDVHCSMTGVTLPNDIGRIQELALGFVEDGPMFGYAVSDTGLHSWGPGAIYTPSFFSELKHPRQIALRDNRACAVTDEGLICWIHDTYAKPELHTDLKNPRSPVRGNSYGCAITDEGVRCWDDGSPSMQNRVPTDLEDPIRLASGEYHACAITKIGVRCWGYESHGNLEVPTDLRNPRELAIGLNHTCVLTDDGVRCWGPRDWYTGLPTNLQLREPYLLSGLRHGLLELSSELYSEKANFLKKLADVCTQDSNELAQTTLILALEPFLKSIPTTSMKNHWPLYLQDRDFLLERYELSSLSTLPHEDSSLRMGLRLIQSALEVSQTLLSQDANHEAAEVKLALGQTLAQAQITTEDLPAALGALDSTEKLASEMSAHPQLTGFAKMIGNLKAWMEQR